MSYTQNADMFPISYGDSQGPMSGMSMLGAGKFPNPFWDIASEYIPRDLVSVFNWCEFLYLTNGSYRTASRRVVRYFLTEIVFDGENEDVQDKYKDLLLNKLHVMTQLAEIGDDFLCFHGDTKVVTKSGIFAIRDLAGSNVEVLSKDGKYRHAAFKAYGQQALLEVEFADGRTVLATPEHRWHVKKATGGTVVVPTTELAGRRIERTVAPRPEKNAEYREGVRHGFVFGDGSIYNKHRKTPQGVANFFGAKSAVLPFFEGHGHAPKSYQDGKLLKIHGLPAHYKLLPANTASASYWYGFLCGFLASDGSVDVYGCPLLTQVSRTALEAIVAQLPRLGMVAGPLREYDHTSEFTRDDGTTYEFTGKYCVVSLLKRFMSEDDLILPSHIAKFVDNATETNYGKFIGVKSVTPTGLVDTVYCCVEPDTHTFVIGNGILTGNCYGNCFISLYFPFDRYLICPQCSTTYHIDTVTYNFRLKDGSFTGHCDKCNADVVFKREDRRSPDMERLKIVRWNPKYVRLRVHPISGHTEYYLELDPTFVRLLEEGNRFFLNQTPWSMIEAVRQAGRSQGMPIFKFRKEAIYHLKEPTLAGLLIRGWGIPPIMPNFKLAFYIQLLRRYDEAIALDFIMPFRVLYPDQAGQQGYDPLSTLNMQTFMSAMQNMVDKKRKNITDIQLSPFPIGYQMIGGEAKALAPKENIALAIDELLNAVGFPAELYKGTLSIQAFPVALRLFEKTWGCLVDGYNDLLQWMVTRISRHYNYGEITAKLRSVTLADDIERKALSLQAAAGMDISKGTAYRPLGIDYMAEQEKVIAEQTAIQKLQQDAMEQQQAQQQGGGAAAGQQGQDPTATQPGATPGDVNEQAKGLAQQLLLQTPETQRRSELIKIKQSNPTLHALVLQNMNEMRQQMASQGQQMVMQQMKQGSADADMVPFLMPINLLLATQILDYGPKDLQKIAMDIKRGIPYAKDAFHFVYARMMGWE